MSSDVPSCCPHCEADQEKFDKTYLGVYECIICSACRNLVASSKICGEVFLQDMEDKENYPASDASDSCNQYDEGASDEWKENVIDVYDVSCEIDLIDNGYKRCTESEFLPLDHHQRRLRNSCSVYGFEEQRNVRDFAVAQSATLDNGDLSRDSLKQAREHHCLYLRCTNCSSPDSLMPVEGIKDIFHCSNCFSVHGVDDSINYYDLLQKGDYVVEACVECGNSDPDLFCLECGSSPDSIELRCVKCSDMAQGSEYEGVGDVEITEEGNALDQHMKEWIHYECKCKNSNPELQNIQVDVDHNTVFVKCWSCLREDMIALNDFKPKLCTCNNRESVDVKFDEHGYVSRLVCLQCHAEMDCGAASAADIPAAGDGTSTGRTRVLSINDIQIGDHIASHQFLGYWHHAIVTEVDRDDGQIRVVNYNGPSANKGM